MIRPRIIPCLLLRGEGLYKTVKFKNPTYVGDPINAVKIFNEKEVDELVLLDISATVENKPPNFEKIREIAGECFMPLGYGGGIRSVSDIKTLFSIGVEKVVLNSFALENPGIISEASALYGAQSIVSSIDVKRNFWGKYEVVTHSSTHKTGKDPVDVAISMVKAGAGEILLTCVDRDGTMQGMDIKLIKSIASVVNVPVVASGGAWMLSHLREAVKDGHASAVAIGSMCVFQGKHRAVLITYPDYGDIKRIFQ